MPNLPSGVFLESGSLLVMEAENGTLTSGISNSWQITTTQSGYTGTAYLQARPDLDTLYQTGVITGSPKASYPLYVTTPGTYTVWLRGYPTNAAGDSIQVGLGTQLVEVSGLLPGGWSWANKRLPTGQAATLVITTSGVYTVNLWMREDGLRLDRLLLTTNAGFTPTSFGPAESGRYGYGVSAPTIPLTRTLAYMYDNLYRLITATYTTGESYAYEYDPVGNRLKQIINGNTTIYLYDAANRLSQVNGQSYTFDNNGNLKLTGAMTNTFDAANRLTSSSRSGTTVQPIYNGVGDRVGQTVGTTTTHFALDVEGLPEVIYTSAGEVYLHLLGVIVTQKASQVRYLLSDGLGSIRQAVDENRAVVAYTEFDPYGNPVNNTPGGEPYGYTGEWWESYPGLLHLRARWYLVETGTFLSRDPVESEPPYLYVRGNPINWIDPSGTVTRPPNILLICLLQGKDPKTCNPGPQPVAFGATTTAAEPYSGAIQLIATLGVYVTLELAEPAIREAIEEWAEVAEKAWESKPKPRVTPPPPIDIYIEPTCTPTPELEQHLYHYTFAENIPSIIATGLRPSIRNPNDPTTDAQWGDGQYLTDLTPEDASTATRYQVSKALFSIPWIWGRPPNLRDIGWIKIDVSNLPVRRVAPLFSPDRFPGRSIYLHDSTVSLTVANRVRGTGLVTFQPSQSGYR